MIGCEDLLGWWFLWFPIVKYKKVYIIGDRTKWLTSPTAHSPKHFLEKAKDAGWGPPIWGRLHVLHTDRNKLKLNSTDPSYIQDRSCKIAKKNCFFGTFSFRIWKETLKDLGVRITQVWNDESFVAPKVLMMFDEIFWKWGQKSSNHLLQVRHCTARSQACFQATGVHLRKTNMTNHQLMNLHVSSGAFFVRSRVQNDFHSNTSPAPSGLSAGPPGCMATTGCHAGNRCSSSVRQDIHRQPATTKRYLSKVQVTSFCIWNPNNHSFIWIIKYMIISVWICLVACPYLRSSACSI
jgi:hypothetical protein